MTQISTIDDPKIQFSSLRALTEDSFVGIENCCDQHFLVACRVDGKSQWRLPLDSAVHMAGVSEETIWLFGKDSISSFDSNGQLIARFCLPLESGEKIGAVFANENEVFVSTHMTTKSGHVQELIPRVLRLDSTSKIIWSSSLPVPDISFRGCVETGVKTNWKTRVKPAWKPSTWLPFGEDQLLISGNRLAASYWEMPRSGIGRRYVLDSETGDLIWYSDSVPDGKAISVGDGSFLFGSFGYGAFETTKFQSDGPTMTWPSHGYCFVADSGREYCIELDNAVSKPQFVVELCAGGTVTRLSDRLPGFYTSKPQPLKDGMAYFWRGGAIWSFDPESGIKKVMEVDLGKRAYAQSIRMSDRRAGFLVRRNRTENESAKSRLVVIATNVNTL